MSDDRSMRWKCAWCGKPHERNDPPCDNCGHHKFEQAVVPVAPEDPDYERQPVWVCTECGRQHQKNSPPCSRCGNGTLEKHVPSDEDFAEELDTPSYVDLFEPRYGALLAVALVAGAVLVLAAVGVVTLPGMGGDSLSVSDVPGSADTANGVSLAEAEEAYVRLLNDRREGQGLDALERNDRHDAIARFYNQRRVKAAYANGSVPSRDRGREALRDACTSRDVELFLPGTGVDSARFSSPTALARPFVESYVESAGSLKAADGRRVGVDFHVAPDGRVYVAALAC